MASRRLFAFCFALWLGISISLQAEEPLSSLDEQPVGFAKEILPILSDKCFACHGPDTKEAGLLRLDSYEAATEDLGGYRAIDAERPEASELLVRIFSGDNPMPPRDADKQLTEQQRDLLAAWVRGGGLYEKHWAFVPPVKPEITFEEDSTSNVQGGSLQANEAIDYFIVRTLQAQGLDAAATADRATLARRVALALTGLPPKIDQLDRFLNDPSDDAYERLVDELLASSRFGEHQARYWLDAVRYGDTHGLHLDNRRGIYPYRDWVVRAFNQNLPLNDFITWQVAGDLLPEPSLEQLAATGFVRLNPSTGEGGAIGDEFQAKNNFDRTETLGTVLLGMSLVCARCHTHKYDPIYHHEYYQLMAFFNSTAEPPLDGNSYTYGDTVKVPADQAQWQRWEQISKDQTRLLERANHTLSDPKHWESLVLLANQRLTDATSNTSDSEISETVQPKPEHWSNVVAASHWSKVPVTMQLRIIADAEGVLESTDVAEARKILQFAEEAEKSFTTTLVARDLPTPRPTRVLRRGEYDMPIGDPVEPDVPSVLGRLDDGATRNRLGLARWLTSPDNPLVARVLVNRFWQQVFGYGLVRTPEDFGLQGEQPTHPELLDWLAVELKESGWDFKRLMKLMVTSDTFKQRSEWRENIDDPHNRLWARGPSFRLDAEVIRDVGLWASGLLDPKLGGEGVKPYQPDGMWKALAHPASNTKQYVKDSGPLLYRRSLYIYWKRTSPHPMMTLFDAPDRESSCVRRSRTNTSLQSLGLFNETQRVEMGRKLAERLLNDAPDDHQRLDLLFTLLASRPPNAHEKEVCLELFVQLKQRYESALSDAEALLLVGDAERDQSLNAVELAAWTQVCVTILASDLALTLN